MKDRINFKKVKKVQDGFLADGMFIPQINSNRHYKILKEWIEKGGLLEEELTLDKLRIQKILNIKTVAKNKIAKKYPAFKQRNILMSQDIKQISIMSSFIKKIADKSNLLEELLNDISADQLSDFDASQEENWS